MVQVVPKTHHKQHPLKMNEAFRQHTSMTMTYPLQISFNEQRLLIDYVQFADGHDPF